MFYIARHLIQNGVGLVHIYDQNLTTNKDISTCFFFSKEDLGQPRSKVACQRLAYLSNHTTIESIDTLVDYSYYQVE